ncbi:MAG: polysaccharide biosynthesis protein [Cyclobacteriaceae bacterium]
MSELAGKKLVILGGTGSLGQALVRQIIASYSDIGELMIISRDEVKQLRMMDEFSEEEYPFMNYLLGDVRDKQRLIELLKGKDLVIHAAAIKHVVIAEKNPSECKKTNVEGTRNVVLACLEQGVKKALLISTDKAVNPISVYGRSKQVAEQIFLTGNSKSESEFGVIRLGNILGSRGSVFELFKEQKSQGLMKVTHQDATRFYITPEDASDFVLNSLIEIDTNTIKSPKMKAFRVLDLAKSVAPDCRIEIVGLRPGDKLHEELEGKSSEDYVETLNPLPGGVGVGQ